MPGQPAGLGPAQGLDGDPLNARPEQLGDGASVHGHAEVPRQREMSEIDALEDHIGPGMLALSDRAAHVEEAGPTREA